MDEVGVIYQSPIALGDHTGDKTVKRSNNSSLVYDQRVDRYLYDSKRKEWIVYNTVSLANNGLNYRLKDIHTHIPAEHWLRGKQYALEIHFVFADPDSEFLVLGFLAKLDRKSSPLFSRLLRNHPLEIPQIKVSYDYAGSLTSPPALDNLQWIVSSKVLRISLSDLVAFQSFSKPSEPLKPRAGRDIVLVRH
jgi:carbonic anhydrase